MKVRPMEWIRKPDANADGLLRVELTDMEFGVPVGVETHNVFEEEVTMDQEQEFEMILESTGQTKFTGTWRIMKLIPIATWPRNRSSHAACSLRTGKILLSSLTPR